MHHSEVLGESFVSSVMHEDIFQVFAVGTGSVGNHQTQPLPRASAVTRALPSSSVGSTRRSLWRIISGRSLR